MVYQNNKNPHQDLLVLDLLTSKKNDLSSIDNIVYEYYLHHNISRVYPLEIIFFYTQFTGITDKATFKNFLEYLESESIKQQHLSVFPKLVTRFIKYLQKQLMCITETETVAEIRKSKREALQDKINAFTKYCIDIPPLSNNHTTIRKILKSELAKNIYCDHIQKISEDLSTKNYLTLFDDLHKSLCQQLNCPSLRICMGDGSVLPMKPSNIEFSYASRGKHPEAKLHSIIDMKSGLPVRSVITTGAKNERDYVSLDGISNTCLILDRGYLKIALLKQFEKQGNFYLCRATRHTNPGTVLRAFDENNQPIHSFKRKSVKDCQLDIKNNQFYAVLYVKDKKRKSEDNSHKSMKHEIVIGFNKKAYFQYLRDEVRRYGRKRKKHGSYQKIKNAAVRQKIIKEAKSQAHFCFYTNIRHQYLDPQRIAMLYSFRWSIELFFKDLKSGCNLTTSNAICSEIRINHFLASMYSGLLKHFCVSKLIHETKCTETLSVHKVMLTRSEKMANVIKESLFSFFTSDINSVKKYFDNSISKIRSWLKKSFKVSHQAKCPLRVKAQLLQYA